MADQHLPNPGRYIPSNDDDANSFLSKNLPESLEVVKDLGGAEMRLGYTITQSPTRLTNDADLSIYRSSLKELPPLVRPGGSGATNVWYIDTPPDSESPMHRTVSLDFVIQISGEIELTLASAEQRTIRAGDITIQRCTLHKWRNPSKTQWSRMVGIMAECESVSTKNKGCSRSKEVSRFGPPHRPSKIQAMVFTAVPERLSRFAWAVR